MKLNLFTLLLLLLAGVVVISHSGGGLVWTPWHIAGLAVAVPALILFVLARLQLGSSFSVRARARTLVTTGIYSRVRNPIYVFGSLVVAGALLWMARPWWLLIFVVLIPVQAVRARNEARVLQAEFGAAYLDYKRKTWF